MLVLLFNVEAQRHTWITRDIHTGLIVDRQWQVRAGIKHCDKTYSKGAMDSWHSTTAACADMTAAAPDEQWHALPFDRTANPRIAAVRRIIRPQSGQTCCADSLRADA